MRRKCFPFRCIQRYAPRPDSSGGETGKSEAWVVIEAGGRSRHLRGSATWHYSGDLRISLANRTIAAHLVAITPKAGDSVFIPAGTVHTLGGGVVVFEIQQNSDVTFRLYDWESCGPENKAAPRAPDRSSDCQY